MITALRARRSPARPAFHHQDAAELAGLLAALSRSGLAPQRIWQLLSEERSAVAGPAAQVSAMLAVGGTVSAGLRIAAAHATGEGAQALVWLTITAEVTERTGAPAAAVYDGLVQGIHAELDQAGETAVALAGPRATALVLGVLPLAGAGLGLLMGVNSIAVLLGTGPGRMCLLLGAAFWLAGRRWIARLLAGARSR